MATANQTLSDTELAVSEKLLAQARAADEWECYRQPHAVRIAAIADALARKFNLARQDRVALRLASLAHDLGIMVMQRDYIGRNGRLTLEERLDLARHPIIGEQEAMRLGTPRAVQLIVRWHHEAWNGSGYPDALQREQIPLAARILRVADTYASLTDERPFRSALREEDALRVIAEGAGLEFDPAVAQTLFMLEDLPELRSYASRQQLAERQLEALSLAPASLVPAPLPPAVQTQQAPEAEVPMLESQAIESATVELPTSSVEDSAQETEETVPVEAEAAGVKTSPEQSEATIPEVVEAEPQFRSEESEKQDVVQNVTVAVLLSEVELPEQPPTYHPAGVMSDEKAPTAEDEADSRLDTGYLPEEAVAESEKDEPTPITTNFGPGHLWS